MNQNHEITKEIPVPGTFGTIDEPGFSRSPVMKYTRENMKAPWFRKKEWDYYLFNNSEIAVAFTISDLGYAGLLSASVIDLKNRTQHTESEVDPFPRGKRYGLGASTSDADASCHTKRLDLTFSRTEKGRHISCIFRNFDKENALTAELDVYEPDMEAMYIATPWKEKPTAFYYNCKMNCLEAEGTVAYGDRIYRLNREDTLGVLDWGRGIWTYDNTWYWGTGSGRIGGEPFGFNLGYGFSDRTAASENCVFYRGKLHKLQEISFGIPVIDGKKEYLKPWDITSDDGRFRGTFTPILDRNAFMDFKVILSDQHQVFGTMDAEIVLDSGEKLEIRDFISALEEVRNKY